MTSTNLLFFSSALFFIGLLGVLIRRNILIMMMCVELMLNASNMAFVSMSRQLEDTAGQMAVLFIITVAAAEAAVGLGLLIALFRNLKTVSTDDIQLLRE